MLRKNIKAILSIVFILLFLIMIGLVVSTKNVDKQNEKTTTLYEATVTEVKVNDAVKDIHIEIYSEEYTTMLFLTDNICEYIDLKKVEELERGQKIFFRVANEKTHHINKSKFVDIVSLTTETKEIISLQDYNKYMKESLKPTRIAGLIAALIFLVAFFVIACNRKSRAITGRGSVLSTK